MKIKRLFTDIKKIFTWHLYPRRNDLRIKSFVEFLFYLAITLFLVYVFYCWHQVPERNIVMVLDKVCYQDCNKDDSIEALKTIVTINIPMTNREYAKNEKFKIELTHSEYIKQKDSEHQSASWPKDDSFNELSRILYDSIKTDHNIGLWDEFMRRYPSVYNHKKRLYCGLACNLGPSSRGSYKVANKIDTIRKDTLVTFCKINVDCNKNAFFNYLDAFESFNYFNGSRHQLDSANVLGKPKWLRLEDISQSYFDFRIITHSIDSLILKIDFVGVTEFSEMIPKPDVIGMGSIEFNDPAKIRQIGKEGLLFHAQFKEIENMQTVRLLAITTLLGSIVFVFVGLLFIFLYLQGSKIKNWVLFIKGHIIK